MLSELFFMALVDCDHKTCVEKQEEIIFVLRFRLKYKSFCDDISCEQFFPKSSEETYFIYHFKFQSEAQPFYDIEEKETYVNLYINK